MLNEKYVGEYVEECLQCFCLLQINGTLFIEDYVVWTKL